MARIARSLETLRNQINAAYPNRSKTSDGWLGDASHQTRKSDHNPNAAGVVQGIDITHDPDDGLDAGKVAETILFSRDPRIKYVISNARVGGSPGAIERKQIKGPAWAWHAYTGPNAHRLHFHVSVMDDPSLYDDASPWKIGTQMAITSDVRRRMAQEIVNFEARRDAQGKLEVFQLPASDGGGAYEVAGINVANHPQKAVQLRTLILEGRQAEAETAACDYILEYTNPAASWHEHPGVEFYLRDSFFNRGPTGAARILQRAVGVEDDGIVGPITRAAIAKFPPAQLLAALRNAREDYERNVVGYRAEFWNGLTNRWNKALAVAQTFTQEPIKIMPEEPKPTLPALPIMGDGKIDLQFIMQLMSMIAGLVQTLQGIKSQPAPEPIVIQPPPPPPPPTPVLEKPSVQLGVGAGIITTLLQAFGTIAPPVGTGSTTAGTLATVIPLAITAFGGVGGFGSILRLVSGAAQLFSGLSQQKK